MTEMPTDRTDRFRQNLSALCEEHGRCTEIAAAVGVSRVHLWRVATGKSVPSLELALKIADAVDVPLDSLLNNELEAVTK